MSLGHYRFRASGDQLATKEGRRSGYMSFLLLFPKDVLNALKQTRPCLSATTELLRYAILLGFGFSNLSVTSGFRLERAYLATSSLRVLVVEDYEPFRRFVASILQKQQALQIICEVSDGLEAVQKAKELQPDLILLDIGLPTLNGIEAGRQIRKLSPKSKIVFVSQESSADVVREALGTGACGYVLKTDAGSELLTAVDTVLRGEQFVGSRFAGRDFSGASDAGTSQGVRRSTIFAAFQRQKIARRHEAGFYSDDASLLDGFTQFIGTALKAGNAVIVVATESHRENLLPRLQGHGVDISAAIEEGRYVSLDAADTLSKFMVNDLPDPARFLEAAANLIAAAAKAAKGEHPRVAVCGECDPPLWTLGKGEAAIRLEQLWNKIAETHDIDILCGYPLGGFHSVQGSHIFRRICAEHSAVYSR
jgi:DNA-binding NarL/FixJ family response regulator